MWNSIFESGNTVVLVQKITFMTHYDPFHFYSDQKAVGFVLTSFFFFFPFMLMKTVVR